GGLGRRALGVDGVRRAPDPLDRRGQVAVVLGLRSWHRALERVPDEVGHRELLLDLRVVVHGGPGGGVAGAGHVEHLVLLAGDALGGLVGQVRVITEGTDPDGDAAVGRGALTLAGGGRV